MKLKYITFLLIALIPIMADAAKAKTKKPSKNTISAPIEAIIDYVQDGDTFGAMVSLKNDIKITVRVRIMNIDTPEMDGKCDAEIAGAVLAKKRLQNLLAPGKRVMLHDVKDDKYLGRIDANVVDMDGRNIGDIMVRENLARKYSGKKRLGWCEN